MTSAELARFQVAVRAYRKCEPSEAEVQAGVRRARLALRRPAARRAWLPKAVVFVVLALGGLAYAKPSALQDWASQALGRFVLPAATTSKGVAAPTAPDLPFSSGVAPLPTPVLVPEPLRSDAKPAAARSSASEGVSAGSGPARNGSGGTQSSLAAPQPSGARDTPSAVSDWGRVGQALANGDEQTALRALTALSGSPDERTRDKADLGRAQLLMAGGSQDMACALARSLTQRRAGSRIERQAQLILRDCSR